MVGITTTVGLLEGKTWADGLSDPYGSPYGQNNLVAVDGDLMSAVDGSERALTDTLVNRVPSERLTAEHPH